MVCLGNDFISANLSKDIDKFYKISYNIYSELRNTEVAQSAERAHDKRKVTGSIPVFGTTCRQRFKSSLNSSNQAVSMVDVCNILKNGSTPYVD